tara:strand:+ start:638 stop:868 length:231 start_codon:yes stop_codon:yes gene_type:complete
MNEQQKNKSRSSDQEVLDTLRRMEKHLQDLVYYTTPERAFMSSGGRAAPENLDELSENTIRELVTQEVKRLLKEKK